MSLSFVALVEGLTDLRLLCALESISDGKDDAVSREIRAFLDQVLVAAPPTERLTGSWDEAEEFDQLRNQAVRLWIKAHEEKEKN